MQYIPIAWAVNIATFFIAAGEWSSAILQKLIDMFRACCAVFEDKTYIIFEHDAHPYEAATVQHWASGSAVPRWLYNATRKDFLAWGDSSETKSYALPWLSLEIIGGQQVHYDLTDFIEGIRVRCAGEQRQYPTLPEVLGAWTKSSGIVLHPTRFTARLITEEGDTQGFTLDGTLLDGSGAAATEAAAEEAKED